MPTRVFSHIKRFSILAAVGLLEGCQNSSPSAPEPATAQVEPYMTVEEYAVASVGTLQQATRKFINEMPGKDAPGEFTNFMIVRSIAGMDRGNEAVHTLKRQGLNGFQGTTRNKACLNAFQEIAMAYLPLQLLSDPKIDLSFLDANSKTALDLATKTQALTTTGWGLWCLQPQ